MATYRTPDVYVEEISVFPPSVAEVGTAIPAFIGYTQKAGDDVKLKPKKIYSLKEYEDTFGFPQSDSIVVNLKSLGKDGYEVTGVTEPTVQYLMYFAIRMYFDNGGAQCYVVSVGGYKAAAPFHDWEPAAPAVGIKNGLEVTGLEDEPTLIVIPEAFRLGANYGDAVKGVLSQCARLGDRFGILDVNYGADPTKDITSDSVALTASRNHFGSNNLKYGAAYYPFVKTSLAFHIAGDKSNVTVAIDGAAGVVLNTLTTTNTAAYNTTLAELSRHFITMPPSAAVAGVYAAVDTARGVWKAPANVSVADVAGPAVLINNLRQENLNIDTTGGLSINAIRAFAGKGTLVWGARTLAGNDNEWRYVPVRRFFIMVEESVKKSTYWAVFEPNDANTWAKVRGMIENYLTDKWRDGALAGATPKEAFFVKCGLGTTMTAQDILQGKMIVEIGMAVVRPAEFIVLRFSHKMQTS